MALKAKGASITRGHAGRRFQDRYAAARQTRTDPGWRHRARRVLRLVLALGAIVVGLALMVLPGPAFVFFILAGSLLATESLPVARFLDGSEVRMRAGWAWGTGHWRRLSGAAKIAASCLVAGVGTGLAYLSYRVITS